MTFVRIRSAAAAAAADEEQKNLGQPYGDYYAWNELPPLTGVQMVVVVVVALWISWWSTATATVVSRRERWTGRLSTDAMSEY